MRNRRTSVLIASILAASFALPASACRYNKRVDFKNIFAADLVIEASISPSRFEGGGDEGRTYDYEGKSYPDYKYAWMQLRVQSVLLNQSGAQIEEGDLVSAIWQPSHSWIRPIWSGIFVFDRDDAAALYPDGSPDWFDPGSGLRLLSVPCGPTYFFHTNSPQWRAIQMVFDGEGHPPEVEAEILGDFLYMNGGPF